MFWGITQGRVGKSDVGEECKGTRGGILNWIGSLIFGEFEVENEGYGHCWVLGF